MPRRGNRKVKDCHRACIPQAASILSHQALRLDGGCTESMEETGLGGKNSDFLPISSASKCFPMITCVLVRLLLPNPCFRERGRLIIDVQAPLTALHMNTAKRCAGVFAAFRFVRSIREVPLFAPATFIRRLPISSLHLNISAMQ